MSRRIKIDPNLKIEVVEKYLNYEIGLSEAERLAGVHSHTVITGWVRIYKKEGPQGFLNPSKNNIYSKELKHDAVLDYLNGDGSLEDICDKYKIRSNHTLRQWILLYTTGKPLKMFTGGTFMKKARSLTPEERLQIVKDCLEHDRNYGAAAIQYNCSYQQVRYWVQKYEKMGTAGLEDRRGSRAGTRPSRTPEEKMRDEIARLERKNKDLQMEIDVLKKVRELERRDRFH